MNERNLGVSRLATKSLFLASFFFMPSRTLVTDYDNGPFLSPVRLSVRPSVCLSIRRVDHRKTVEVRIISATVFEIF